MKAIALPAIALFLLGGGAVLQAQSAPQKPGALDASRVMAGSYAVDPGHTLVGWEVDHFGFSDYFGMFGDVTGTLDLNPADISSAKLSVTIPVSKVTVASAGLRDHLLRAGKDGGKPDFFGAAPADATFVSTTVRQTSANQALINGMLTLNGVTKPVAIMAEFSGAGAHPMNKKLNIGFRGWGEIKRSDFGIDYGIPLVSDEVQLNITAAFELAAEATGDQPSDLCKSALIKSEFGKPDSADRRSAVSAAVGHDRIRWITPGTAVTRDYRPDRLNIDIDAQGILTGASCG